MYAIFISVVTAKVSEYNLKLWRVYPFKLLVLSCMIALGIWNIKFTDINKHLSFIVSLAEIIIFWWFGVTLLNEKARKKSN